MNYESLIIQQANYQTKHGPQSELRWAFCEDISSFVHAIFPISAISPASYNLQNSWLKKALTSTVGTSKIYLISFSPLLEHTNTTFPTLRISSRTECYPKKSRKENYPPNHHLLSCFKTLSAVVLLGSSRNLSMVNTTCLGEQNVVVMN